MNKIDGKRAKVGQPSASKKSASSHITHNPPPKRKRNRACRLDTVADLDKEAADAVYCGKVLAETLDITRRHLHRSLFQTTGERLRPWLQELKLEGAREKLQSDPKLLIRDVAKLFGYSHPSSLTRAFVRYFGKTPKAVRAEGREPRRIAVLNL